MSTILNFQVLLLPGSPTAATLSLALGVLLGENGILVPKKLGDERLSKMDPVIEISDKYLTYQQHSERGNVEFVYGQGDSFITLAFSLDPDGGSSISGYLPGLDSVRVVGIVSELAEILDAPLSILYTKDPPSISDLQEDMDGRTAAHIASIFSHLEKTGGTSAPVWFKDGLCGIAWRTLIGKPFIDLFTSDRLAALGSDLAWENGSHWVLAGSETPESWSYNPVGDQERSMIESIGSQYFYDIETGELPTVFPHLPKHPKYPITLRNLETGELYTVERA